MPPRATDNGFAMLMRFFSSLRLTLALMLGLAFVCVFGTLNRAPDARFYPYFQSPWFRGLLVLLALNLLVCTSKTIRRNLGDRRRYGLALESEALKAYPARTLEPFAAVLRRCGFRVWQAPSGLIGYRGRWGRWGSTLVHLSVLLIMAGAWAGGFGFVGTLNIHVGDKSAVCFDWGLESNRPLGFEFRLDHFEPLYYPIEVEFAVLDRPGGTTLDVHKTSEGRLHALPVGGLWVRVHKFLVEEKTLVLHIYRGAEFLGEYRAASGRRVMNQVERGGLEFEARAYRDPILRQMHSEVSLLRDGRVVKQGVIEVNHPLVFEGVSIYQTAFNRDKFGFWYAGFQFSRDPGEPLVWLGCLLLVTGLGLAFFVPCRVLGVGWDEGGKPRFIPLSGFATEAGQKAIERLARDLNI